MFENIKFDQHNHLQIGKIGEYWFKLALTLRGFDVYTTEVDDKGLDFIVRLNHSTIAEIQVKTVWLKSSTSYVFVQKKSWDRLSGTNDSFTGRTDSLRDNLFLGLVLLQDYKPPQTYLVPATAWLEPNEIFKDNNYGKAGQKSLPEWGINVSKRNLHLLDKYNLSNEILGYKPIDDKKRETTETVEDGATKILKGLS